jgi:hypothetical protein
VVLLCFWWLVQFKKEMDTLQGCKEGQTDPCADQNQLLFLHCPWCTMWHQSNFSQPPTPFPAIGRSSVAYRTVYFNVLSVYTREYSHGITTVAFKATKLTAQYKHISLEIHVSTKKNNRTILYTIQWPQSLHVSTDTGRRCPNEQLTG